MGAKFNTLRTLCREAVDGGVVPGAVVLVGNGETTLFHEAFGVRQRGGPTASSPALPALLDTIYDLASLTKPLVTSLLVMKGAAGGRLALDDAVRDGITVRQLLAHAGGLPAHRALFEHAKDRADVVARAAAEPLVYTPGTRSLYSDLGFILLGDLVERRLGARLDTLAGQMLFGPLGLGSLRFGGQGKSPFGDRPVAATELCPVRKRLIVGEVHDLNAWAMGGVAGHAGLFGTAADLAALARAMMTVWKGGTSVAGAGWLEPEVLREFWAPAGIPGSTWRLGWDGPAESGSAAGQLIARRAVGHLAFTGCSLWIDPERETFVIVLSNRIHPVAAENPPFRALRPALNDAALQDAGYAR